ncbi:hypothetical protein AAG570_010890 [Ranatra chinensis]|uniref:Uncharacterized protein n=1 Tax=Ranatra chinensis TaxID=642074 RepID=A0ABD0YXF5_9HEMI
MASCPTHPDDDMPLKIMDSSRDGVAGSKHGGEKNGRALSSADRRVELFFIRRCPVSPPPADAPSALPGQVVGRDDRPSEGHSPLDRTLTAVQSATQQQSF